MSEEIQNDAVTVSIVRSLEKIVKSRDSRRKQRQRATKVLSQVLK